MTDNILNRTKCYLIGSMQYENGEAWRERAESVLKEMGVIPLNPYRQPFIDGPPENEDSHTKWQSLLEEGKYDEVSEVMSKIRNRDLSMVDKSDFLICYLKTSVFTAGTMEELVSAVQKKRPVFVVMEGGKKKTPFWILGMLPAKYIHDSFEEVFDILGKINSGEKEFDGERWRLLKPEYR